MALFDDAFDFMIINEVRNDPNGGYTNDPDDPGGETKWGVSKRSFPHIDIKNLTKEDAKNLVYKPYFWVREYDFFKSSAVAIRVFDMAVNSGERNAADTIQKAINICCTNPLVKEDGEIGNETIKVANVVHQGWLLDRFRVERMKYYADCVRKNPHESKFLEGWINRNYL